MTSQELRALRPSTIQERFQIEVAAQVAELNENFQKFFAMQEKLNLEKAIANTEPKAPATKRTAIVEK